VVPSDLFSMEEISAGSLPRSSDGGIDGEVGYSGTEEEGVMILSQRSRSFSAFRTKMGYISFNAAVLNAGSRSYLYVLDPPSQTPLARSIVTGASASATVSRSSVN